MIATATIAGIAGGGGLGEIIVNQAIYGLAGVLAAALCVSAMALAGGVRCSVSLQHAAVAPDGSDERRVPGDRPGEGQAREEGTMFRKHTRRAAKAAFAISFGVALLIG